MIKKFIKKLRARPEHVRTTYALIMSFSKIFEHEDAASSSDSNDSLSDDSSGDSSSTFDGTSEGVSNSAPEDTSLSGADSSTQKDSQENDVQPIPPQTTNTQSSKTQSASFDDILNTKKQDNQGNNATTSNQVLVQ